MAGQDINLTHVCYESLDKIRQLSCLKNVYLLNMGANVCLVRMPNRARHSVIETLSFRTVRATEAGACQAIFTVFMTVEVEGHSLTQIVRELGVSEPYTRIWTSRTRFIMAMDAEKRQAEIVFGQLVTNAVAFIG